jgi:hypothetical protein
LGFEDFIIRSTHGSKPRPFMMINSASARAFALAGVGWKAWASPFGPEAGDNLEFRMRRQRERGESNCGDEGAKDQDLISSGSW